MNVSYAYNAAMYCDHCAEAIIEELEAKGIADEGDTDSYPQKCFDDEADCPQHCDDCHEFLQNSLTADGVEYVTELIREHHESGRGNAEVLREWAEFYDLPFDVEVSDDA